MAKTTDDLKHLMDQFVDTVDQAVSSGDFSTMSRELGHLARDAKVVGTDAIRSATESYRSRQTVVRDSQNANSGGEHPRNGQLYRSEYQTTNREINYGTVNLHRNEETQLAPYFMPPASTMGKKIVAVLGAASGVLCGSATAIAAIAAVATGAAAGWIVTTVFGAMTAGSIAIARMSGRSARLLDHFNTYRRLLGGRLYADIRELADRTYFPQQQIVKELEDLSRRGLIRQGHFDEEKTCFIASDDLYHQYLKTSLQKKAEEAEAKRLEEARIADARAAEALSPEVQKILRNGNEYIEAIRAANNRIPGEEVTGKLDRMEEIVRRIFEEVKQRPELSERLGMFMDYYLPTTRKLVNAYAEMDHQSLQGENISTAKQEIEESLDTINDAFETLLDSFFKEQAIDVSSDISVMKTMLKQDGLTPEAGFAAQKEDKT